MAIPEKSLLPMARGMPSIVIGTACRVLAF
jgi:hypothetical protein